MDRASPDPRWRDAGKKLLLFASSFAVCFLVLEIYVRTTWQPGWHIPKEAVRAPGIFSTRMKADVEVDIPLVDGGSFHVKTNARGFRGPLVSEIADRPLRVVSLGDSYTFGWGLALEDHGMARFVATYRAAHPDRDVGHAYVACASWDPKDYYYAYLTEASAAHPDLVVLGVFSGNDSMPADAPRVLDPAQAVSVEKVPDPPSALFRSLGWLEVQLASNLFAAQVGFRARGDAAFALFDRDPERQRKLWDTSFFYLRALHEAVRRDGGRLAILLYPSLLQVEAKDQLERAGYDHAMPEKVLGELCREQGIELVTLLDALERNDQKRDLFFPKDRHLAARGNEVAAAVLGEELGPVLDRLWDAKAKRVP
jgi:hypothetical protein